MQTPLSVTRADKARSLPMRGIVRLMLFGVAGLAILSFAPALFQVISAPSQHASTMSTRASTIAATRTWFASLNRYLDSGAGDSSVLALSPGFVDHNPAPGMTGDAQGFQATFDLLKLQFANIQLRSDIEQVDGDIVTVRVTATPGATSQPARTDASGQWSYSERLRIESGLVVERWGPELPIALEAHHTALQTSTGPLMVFGRISRLQTGAGSLSGVGNTLMLVESGEVRFHSTHGLARVQQGIESTGLPNLVTNLTGHPGDLVFAVDDFAMETSASASLLVFEKGRIYASHTSSLYGGVSRPPSRSGSGMNSDERRRLRPFAWQGGPGSATLTILTQVPQAEAVSVARTGMLLPADSALPEPSPDSLTLVTIHAGEVRDTVEGLNLRVGDSFEINAGDQAGRYLVTQPASLELITVTMQALTDEPA